MFGHLAGNRKICVFELHSEGLQKQVWIRRVHCRTFDTLMYGPGAFEVFAHQLDVIH